MNKTEAHLITNAHNIQYLSGFTGTNGIMLLTKNQKYLFTDFRYERVAKKILLEHSAKAGQNIKLVIVSKMGEAINENLKKHGIKTLHFEENDLTVARHHHLQSIFKKIKLTPGKLFVEQFRMIKTAQEITKITKAQRIAEKTLELTLKKLKVGITEAKIAWEIEKTGHELGADTISFPSIVAFGANSGSPHHMSGSRKLKKGEMVLIDMGMKYQGYCSDMTRTYFTKPPTALEEKIYNTVLKAQTEAEKHVKAGVKGSLPDKIARDIITKAGYGDRFGHSLGHGIGLEVHEAPNLSTGYDKPLPDNTIVTIEPGIYLANSFGVRIEDMVLIRGSKAVNLTNMPKKIERLILTIH